jgi:hypothetical protein
MRSHQLHLHFGGKSFKVQNIKNPFCKNNFEKEIILFVINKYQRFLAKTKISFYLEN